MRSFLIFAWDLLNSLFSLALRPSSFFVIFRPIISPNCVIPSYFEFSPIIVKKFNLLRCYKWCGHGSLLGFHSIPWQNTSYVLSKFEIGSSTPKKKYLKFIKEELTNKEIEELVWGNYILGNSGIVTSTTGKKYNGWQCSCRILGSKEFALDTLTKIRETNQWPIRNRKNIHENIKRILECVQKTWGFSLNQLRGDARNSAISDARALVSWVCSDYLGLSNTENAVLLGMSRTGIAKAIQRGEELYADSKFISDILLL